MNIFNHFSRTFSMHLLGGRPIIRAKMLGSSNLVDAFEVIYTSGIHCGKLIRTLSGADQSYPHRLSNLRVEDCSDGTVNINIYNSITNEEQLIIKVFRLNEHYVDSHGITPDEETEIIWELARVLTCILTRGNMPPEYRIATDDGITIAEGQEESRYLKDCDTKEPDEDYEDIFHGDTLIERIKNCGDIYGDAKVFPIIVRNGSQKMKIIDTSIEDSVLYIDVKELPSKSNAKKKDYLTELEEAVNSVNSVSFGSGLRAQMLYSDVSRASNIINTASSATYSYSPVSDSE